VKSIYMFLVKARYLVIYHKQFLAKVFGDSVVDL